MYMRMYMRTEDLLASLSRRKTPQQCYSQYVKVLVSSTEKHMILAVIGPGAYDISCVFLKYLHVLIG
jgi:hypothetical protein